MAKGDPIYVVLTISGKVWSQKVDAGYFGILAAVFNELQSAGGSWDAPWRLLCDGEMVVSEKLSDLAYAFGTADREARAAAYNAVRQKHTPEWLAKREAR